jgi:hypothetical protein
MPCHITGILRSPDGDALPNTKLTLKKMSGVGSLADDGETPVVIPKTVTVFSDASGNVDFYLYYGSYDARAYPQKSRSFGFLVGVPEDDSADFAQCVDLVPEISGADVSGAALAAAAEATEAASAAAESEAQAATYAATASNKAAEASDSADSAATDAATASSAASTATDAANAAEASGATATAKAAEATSAASAAATSESNAAGYASDAATSEGNAAAAAATATTKAAEASDSATTASAAASEAEGYANSYDATALSNAVTSAEASATTATTKASEAAASAATAQAAADSVGDASADADRAEAAADRAEAAEDATALIAQTQGAYTDTTIAAAIAAGVAALSADDTFTATGDDVDYIGLYVVDAGGATATEIGRFATYANAKSSFVRLGDAGNYTSLTSSIGSVSEGNDGTLTSAFTRLLPGPFEQDGILAQLEILANASGSITVKLFSRDDQGLFDLESEFDVDVVSGLNVFTPADFGRVDVYSGWYIGIYQNGYVAYATGVSGDSFYLLGDITGTGNQFNNSSSLIQMAAMVSDTALGYVSDLSGRVSGLELYDLGDNIVSVGDVSLADEGVYASYANARIFAWDIAVSGTLKSVKFYADRYGHGTIYSLGCNADGTFYVNGSVDFVVRSGFNDIDMLSHGLSVISGGALAFYSARSGLSYRSGYNSSLYITDSGELVSGTDYAASASSTLLDINAEIYADVDATVSGRVMLRYPLDDVSDFVEDSGSWSADFDGVTSGGSSDERLTNGQYTVANMVSSTVKVTTSSVSDVFGIARKPEELDYGTAGVIDFDAGTISLRPWDGGSVSALSGGVSDTLSITPVSGREYSLELRKDEVSLSLTVRDCITHTSQTITGGESDGIGRGWGNISLISSGGSPKFSNLAHRSTQGRSPRLVMGIDSITEAGQLGADQSLREASLLRDNLGVDVVVSARGGANERDMLHRFRLDVMAYRPDFVRLLVGTNDRDVNTKSSWITRVNEMLGYVRAIGAIPIIGTLPPNGSSQSFLTGLNDYILSGALGPDVRIVDYASALSVGADRVTLNSALFMGDNTHPNVSGHYQMYEQIISDIPEILD